MKNVAALINERKRKVENISKIAKWQSTIENWEVSLRMRDFQKIAGFLRMRVMICFQTNN